MDSTLQDEDQVGKFRFEVDMEEGFERDIQLKVNQRGVNRVKVLVSFGKEPKEGHSNDFELEP